MAVFRVEKNRDFTVMSNHHLRNEKLTLKAKGLLSLKSHDTSQRANGFLTFFGGVIIAFAKDFLDLIMA